MSNSSKLINPYSLLGVSHTCNISELKKNYYNMSLLTHPDKGGSQQDFEIVFKAYNYIKKQIENIRQTCYEELEEEFQQFCMEQKEQKKPCFYEVYEETNDWLNEFNRQFEIQESKELGKVNNPLEKGYGEYLDESEIKLDYELETRIESNQNCFTQELIEYEEPNFLPDYITHFPLDGKDISDFSNLSDKLKSADYKLTHSQVGNLEEEIKKKGNLPEFKDYPTQEIKYST